MRRHILVFLLFISYAFCENTPIAVISKVKGKAFIIREKKEIKIEKYMPVYVRDKLKTLSSSFVELLFENGVSLRIEENSMLDVNEFILKQSKEKIPTKMILKVSKGCCVVDADVFKDKYQLDALYVITPTIVASVRGTVFLLNVKDDDTTDIAVFEGEVDGFLESLDESELMSLEEYEFEEIKRKKISISENKQATFSYDMATYAIVDLSFNMLEYKRSVVEEFLRTTKENRENFEKFKRHRNEWIKKHKEDFKKDILENKERFKEEFKIEKLEFKDIKDRRKK